MRRGAMLAGWMLLLTMCAGAQSRPEAGCTASKRDHFFCQKDGFVVLLAQSKSVRVETGRMDLYGNKQLTRLVEQLGKQVATPEGRADLVFELTWIDRSGRIDVGPSDVAIGRLNVYDLSRGAGDRGLVWVETFDSGEETPWPAITQSLIQQFRQHTVEK